MAVACAAVTCSTRHAHAVSARTRAGSAALRRALPFQRRLGAMVGRALPFRQRLGAIAWTRIAFPTKTRSHGLDAHCLSNEGSEPWLDAHCLSNEGSEPWLNAHCLSDEGSEPKRGCASSPSIPLGCLRARAGRDGSPRATRHPSCRCPHELMSGFGAHRDHPASATSTPNALAVT